MRVFARARGWPPSVVPRADELADPAHRDVVFVETETADRRRIRHSGGTAAGVGKRPIEHPARDELAPATAFEVRAAVGQPSPGDGAAWWHLAGTRCTV